MGSSSNNQNDGDNIAVTDNGNYIVDLVFDKLLKMAGGRGAAQSAASSLRRFIGMTTGDRGPGDFVKRPKVTKGDSDAQPRALASPVRAGASSTGACRWRRHQGRFSCIPVASASGRHRGTSMP